MLDRVAENSEHNGAGVQQGAATADAPPDAGVQSRQQTPAKALVELSPGFAQVPLVGQVEPGGKLFGHVPLRLLGLRGRRVLRGSSGTLPWHAAGHQQQHQICRTRELSDP
jgi:hypothetical protein